MSAHRLDRIGEEIKRELATIIPTLKDPRISGVVSVVAVHVTKDLRFAKVYVSVLGTEEQKENTIKGISSAAGFIRKEIMNKIQLRYTPEFIFKLDSSIEYGAHINKIIGDVMFEKENNNGENN